MKVLAVCRLYRERLWVCRLRPARFANFSRKCALAFSLLPAPSSPSLHPSSSLQPRHYSLRINECSAVSQPLCAYIPLQSCNLYLLRPLHPTNQRMLYSLATSPFFIITSYKSTNSLQFLNLSGFASIYSIATSPFIDITPYQLTNGEIIRSS